MLALNLQSFVLHFTLPLEFASSHSLHLIFSFLLNHGDINSSERLGQSIFGRKIVKSIVLMYLFAHVIEQPIFRIPNLKYLQQNFCFDFFNDSENTF